MSPPNDNNTTGIIDSAREWVHTAVETEEQREAKKPIEEKIKDAMPKSTEEATQQMGEAVNGVLSDIQSKFQERMNENSAGETIRQETDSEGADAGGGLVDSVKDVVGAARNTIYEATEPAVKEETPIMEQVQGSLQEATDNLRKSLAEAKDVTDESSNE